MYQLSNFSSVFEISTALCLAYGIIKSVYQFPLNSIEKELSNAKNVLNDFGSDHPSSRLKSTIGLVERMYILEKPELDKYYLFLSRVSIFMAPIPIIILIFSGFSQYEFSIWTIIGIIVINLAPLPVFTLLTWLKSKKLMESLKSNRKLLKKEVFEVLRESQLKSNRR